MSIFYSQSAKSRDFSYQNTRANGPLELKGNSKRSNAPQDSLRLSTEPSYNPITGHAHGPDTRRTINPQFNKENVDRSSTHSTPQNANYHPGNLMNLFERTANDGDKYDRLRRNKVHDVSKESTDQPSKRHLKPVPLKDLYDYRSGISTLPLTDQIREEKPQKVVRNYTNAYIKEKYDLTSAISTLPGTYNQRNDSLTAPISSKKHSEMALKNLVNTQSSQKAEMSRKPIEPNTSNRNAGSNSNLDLSSQINPLSKPKKALPGRDKLYSQSKEEYFGLRDNPQRHKPMGANNVFQSSIEFR